MTRQTTGMFILFLAAFLLYSPSIGFETNLDDNYIIDSLPAPESGLSGVFSVFKKRFDYEDYRPVPVFTVALEQYVTGGFNIHLSHFMNVLFFCISVIIGFKVLMRLPVENVYWKALLIMLLFVCHPIHANVVCSLKNRDILLSFLLGMSALYLFIRALHSDRRKTLLFILSVLALNLATLAKRDAFSFVLLIPMTYAVFYAGRIKRWRAAVITVAIFGLLLLETQVVFRWIQGMAPITESNIGSAVLYTENPLVVYATTMHTVGAALTSFMYYLKFHLLPWGYYFYFGFDMIPLDNPARWLNLLAVFLILDAIILVLFLGRRNRLLLFGSLFFCLSLVYALNIRTPVAGIVAPRLAFLASFGYCAAIVMLLFELVRSFGPERWNGMRAVFLVSAPLLLIGSLSTLNRSKAWVNMDTLLARDMPRLERSFQAQRIAMAHFSSKAQLEQDGLKRTEYMKQALEHAQLAHVVYDHHIYIEEGMGILMYFLGDKDGAKAQLEMVRDTFQDAGRGMEILGDIYFLEGRFDSAATCFKQHIEFDPLYDASYYKLTNTLVLAGRTDESISRNRELIDTYPDDFIGYDNLGFSYLISGDTIRSAPYFIEAMRRGLPSDDVMFLLQEYYMRHGLDQEWNELLYLLRPPATAQ